MTFWSTVVSERSTCSMSDKSFRCC